MTHHSTAQPDSPTLQDLNQPADQRGIQLSEVKFLPPPPAVEPGAPLSFPGEDRGHSLAEMAQRDLDAALQLLAERAQYITGATGAAIALRHIGQHDMLCRATAGPNAPELGALLSTEFGLSGESVRTQTSLRCDNAETDGRVNRESCRDLGIASVLVTPVLSDGEVLGVFELFSGQANAFGDRDVAALERLAEMVETAAGFARPAHLPDPPAIAEPQPSESSVPAQKNADRREAESALNAAGQLSADPLPTHDLAETIPAPAPKPVLWSASTAENEAADPDSAEKDDSPPPELFLDDAALPLALQGLHKCETCGFPVSEGRRLCLDCDEKNWQAQRPAARKSAPVAPPVASVSAPPAAEPVAPPAEARTTELPTADPPAPTASDLPAPNADDVPVLTAALDSPPSWFAANKYVLGAIAAAALAIAAVALLR
ncbi:MAG: GAF domain-containing protein [Candidatus Sulfotelmatobacter sp.]